MKMIQEWKIENKSKIQIKSSFLFYFSSDFYFSAIVSISKKNRELSSRSWHNQDDIVIKKNSGRTNDRNIKCCPTIGIAILDVYGINLVELSGLLLNNRILKQKWAETNKKFEWIMKISIFYPVGAKFIWIYVNIKEFCFHTIKLCQKTIRDSKEVRLSYSIHAGLKYSVSVIFKLVSEKACTVSLYRISELRVHQKNNKNIHFLNLMLFYLFGEISSKLNTSNRLGRLGWLDFNFILYRKLDLQSSPRNN